MEYIGKGRVQKLCESSRINGVMRFGHSWMIPKSAEKPSDLRKKRKERSENPHV